MNEPKKKEDVTQQILLNISDESFLIHHSADMDILDVYLVLSAALDFIEEEAEAISRKGGSRKEGSYLQ